MHIIFFYLYCLYKLFISVFRMAKQTPVTTGLKKWPPRLSKDNQPSNEAKKAWRDRKRQAQKIMDEMVLYQDMTEAEFQEFIKKKDTKLWQVITATYMREIMKDKKIMTHWLDKHVPNAPQEISWPDWWSIDFTNLNDEDLLRLVLSKNK